MAQTYDPIATQTLGSPAASVTFSSIPATYTDLILVIQAAGATTAIDCRLQFNGDTGANYSYTYLTGNGTAASSARVTGATYAQIEYNGSPSATLGATTTIAHLLNYSNTTTNKTVLSRSNNATAQGTDLVVGLWRSTVAINSILIIPNLGNWAIGSKFTLFGIKAA